MADAFEDRLTRKHNELKAEKGDLIDVPKERQFVGLDAYQKVIDTDPDLVILATPPGFRPNHFEAAVKAGKHVFMEKPVAVDGAGVRMVLAAAEDAKKKKLAVGVGLQRHHQDIYLETIKRLQDGAIGDIDLRPRLLERRRRVGPSPPAASKNEMDLPDAQLVLLHLALGRPHRRAAHPQSGRHQLAHGKSRSRPTAWAADEVRTEKEYGEIFDHHAVEFEYEDGLRMISQCRHIEGCWESVSEHVAGSKGICNIGGGKIDGANPWQYRPGHPTPM